MSRGVPRQSEVVRARKAKKFLALVERYEGKRDLLASWEREPGMDAEYRRDLARRVSGHKSDILYRGGEL
jgi:hypothetical protein